jgi:pSer/pThr/pTyr-binding forkhead associated (FHA) protein/S1-C subfamily serine protease
MGPLGRVTARSMSESVSAAASPVVTRGSIPSTNLGAASEAAIAVLTFIDGLLAGQELELTTQATIGRRKDATIVVPAEERAVSALHCALRRTASGLWIVEDAGSAGGTYLNRERIKPGARPVLTSGDVIGLGAHGPTALFTLRSSTYVGGVAAQVYAITLARSGIPQPERSRFADRPLVVLGRDRDCDLRFDPHADREVSKRHARIRYGGRCFLVEDAGSAAGTLLNGVRLGAATMLRVGDIIELGAGGPKLVVEALEGVDDAREQTEAVLASATRAARRGTRRAMFGAAAAVLVAAAASSAVWWSSRQHADAIAADLDRRDQQRTAAVAVPTTEKFQALARMHEPAMLLVHARFHIEVEGVHDAANPFFAGDTFGSGFVISSSGLAITNRHVAQPWLGEPEYADALARAREAFGADRVAIVSQIAAWPAGSEILGSDRELAFDRGFNSGGLANLRVVGFPPEHLADVPYDGGTVELVANDHTDLALLQLVGASFDAASIPTMAAPDESIQPLDPVMGLGFPAGRLLLEGTKAILTPTLGEVRKIESTVQLSMPTFPGNSGGPVLDAEGRVIGVATRRFGEGVAVCIPVAKVRSLLLHLGVAL